jgi:hypothetical protein
MSSPSSIEEIPINDALKEIGVTKFYKQADVLHLMIGERPLSFDI